MHIRLDALDVPPLVDMLGDERGLMILPPHNPGGGSPNAWHPPHPDLTGDTSATGAMVYEDGDGNFDSVTTNGIVRVRSSDGILIVVLPTVDPVFTGALWNNAGAITISTGIG